MAPEELSREVKIEILRLKTYSGGFDTDTKNKTSCQHKRQRLTVSKKNINFAVKRNREAQNRKKFGLLHPLPYLYNPGRWPWRQAACYYVAFKNEKYEKPASHYYTYFSINNIKLF
jgi:hypothetical protein